MLVVLSMVVYGYCIVYGCDCVLFLARDSITVCLARYMLSPFRLSVCLSHGWISETQFRIVKLSPYSPIPLVFAG